MDPELLRYPARRLAGDYARSLIGLPLTLSPALNLDLNRTVTVILLLLSLLFLLFLAATVRRQRLTIALTEESIVALPSATEIRWESLTGVTLRYYGSRGERPAGELQLSLVAGVRRIRLDSRLNGFRLVLRRAARAAADRGLTLNPVTAGNLAEVVGEAGGSDPGA